MIIFIFVCITVLLIVGAVMFCSRYDFETIGFICLLLSLITGVVTTIMIIVAVTCHIPFNRNQKLTEYQQTYYAITQVISNNDNAVITLTSQIAEYNANVLKGRMMQDSKMLGIFDYDFYYDLPLIELQ